MTDSRETVELHGVHGRFKAFSDDLITGQIAEFGAHPRNEIAMVLDQIPIGATRVDLALLWQKYDFWGSLREECVIHRAPALMEAGDGRGLAAGSRALA